MLYIKSNGKGREGRQAFKSFDMAAYARKMFGMYGGKEEWVRIECDNSFASVMIDRFGKDVSMIRLDEEPDNKYDREAIQVKVKGLGKIGYVANSPFTVKGESMSAGRLYDKIGEKAKGKVVFVVDGGAVCRIVEI